MAPRECFRDTKHVATAQLQYDKGKFHGKAIFKFLAVESEMRVRTQISHVRPVLRFRLGILLSFTAIAAAYLGGRVPYERDLIASRVELSALQSDLKLNMGRADFWYAVAMDSRGDLRESERQLQIYEATRHGEGGSFPGLPNDDTIVPRAKRWSLLFEDEENNYIDNLQGTEIYLLAVKGGNLFEIDWQTSRLNEIDAGALKGRMAIPGNRQDFATIPEKLIALGVDNVIKLIPKELEVELAKAEMRYCQTNNVKLVDVIQTEFALTKKRSSIETTVVSQKTR